MVLVLFKLIFYAISGITDLISKVIFSTTAHFIVLLIHALKVPGEATKGLLEQAADAFRSILESIFELIFEVFKTIISSIFDAVTGGIIETIVSGSSALTDLVVQTKTSLEGLFTDVPDIIQGFAEMLASIVSSLWSNYMEAMGYVQENA